MNDEFEKIWRRTVLSNIEELTRSWNERGGDWLMELTGGMIDDFASTFHGKGKERTKIDMSIYYRFDELSGEEQYAFTCWLENDKYKPNNPKLKKLLETSVKLR